MTDPRPDPVDELLSGLRVPPLSSGLAERIVAEAQRADRVPSSAVPLVRRPWRRRWTRRGVWTAVLAINLAVASAVAAALGSGAIDGSRLIASARHVVERLAHPASARPAHIIALHPHRPAASPGPPPRPVEAPRPLVERPPMIARPLPPRAPVMRAAPPMERARHVPLRAAPRAAMHAAHLQRIRPAWRRRPTAGAAARAIEPERGFARSEQRARLGAGQGFGHPGLYRRRFDGPRLGGFGGRPAKFRGGGRGGRWGMRRGGPRRRF